jgi:hypothetical protein
MKIPKMRRNQAVRVHWRDAYSNPGWHAKEDYERWASGVAYVITVGQYLDHDKANLHLAQSLRGDDRMADIIEVPISLIDKLERLK